MKQRRCTKFFFMVMIKSINQLSCEDHFLLNPQYTHNMHIISCILYSYGVLPALIFKPIESPFISSSIPSLFKEIIAKLNEKVAISKHNSLPSIHLF